jgi:hypothetical protein
MATSFGSGRSRSAGERPPRKLSARSRRRTRRRYRAGVQSPMAARLPRNRTQTGPRRLPARTKTVCSKRTRGDLNGPGHRLRLRGPPPQKAREAPYLTHRQALTRPRATFHSATSPNATYGSFELGHEARTHEVEQHTREVASRSAITTPRATGGGIAQAELRTRA